MRSIILIDQTPSSIAQSYDEGMLADFELAETIIEAQRQLAEELAADIKIRPTELTLEVVSRSPSPSK